HFSSSSMYIYDSLIFHFFSLHGVHPDLHSFPTRRSSDLRLESAVICRMIRRRRMLAPAYTMSATAAAISQSRSGVLRYTMSRTVTALLPVRMGGVVAARYAPPAVRAQGQRGSPATLRSVRSWRALPSSLS